MSVQADKKDHGGRGAPPGMSDDVDELVRARTQELSAANAVLAAEVAEHRLALVELQRVRHKDALLDELVHHILADFAGCAAIDIDATIHSALARVATTIGVERTHVLLADEDYGTWSMAYEWCAADVPCLAGRLQSVPLERSWSVDRLRSGESVVIRRLDDYPPEAQAARRKVGALGARSLLEAPMLSASGRFSGTLGVQSLTREIDWSMQCVDCVRLLAHAVGGIIERKRAEMERCRLERTYREIFDATHEAMFVQDEAGRILDVNERACAMFGYDRATALTLSAKDLFGDRGRPDAAAVEHLRRVIGEGPQLFECQSLRANGETFRSEVALRVCDIGGKRRIISSIRDIGARRRAEQALRDSEEKYRTAVESIDEQLFITNPADGCILECNERPFGISQGVLLGRTTAALGLWRDLDERRSMVERVLSTGCAVELEKSLVLPNGSSMVFLCSTRPIQLSGTTHLLTVVRDITERKRTEETLRRSEELFSKAFHASPVIMAILDLEGLRIVAINVAFARQTGYFPDDIVGHTPFEIGMIAPTRALVRLLRDVRSHLGVHDLEVDYWTRSRERRVALVSAEQIDLSGEARMLLVAEDVTERKHALERLRKDAELGARLLDLYKASRRLTPEGVCDAAVGHAVQLADSPCGFVCQLDEDGEVVCRRSWDCAPSEPHPTGSRCPHCDVAHLCEECALAGVAIVHDEDFDSRERRAIEVPACVRMNRSLCIPVVEEGRTRFVLGVANKTTPYDDHDLTQMQFIANNLHTILAQRRTEEELRRHRDHLEELVRERTSELAVAKEQSETANRAKGRFLASMSHEIRTPLSAILGFCQLMQRDEAATERQRRQLDAINRNGEHLMALLDDVLEISRIEAGRARLNPSVFDLHAELRQVEAMFRQRAEAKGLEFALRYDDSVPRFVSADSGKIRQILINLIGNAVKFTEVGAVGVTVSGKPPMASAASLGSDSTLPAGDPTLSRVFLRARVEDTGHGIAPDELSRLFRPFEQTRTGRRAGAGTGLGLAISREFARLMDGDIEVASAEGHGSAFDVELAVGVPPAGTISPPEGSGTVRRLRSDQPVCRVLVVDDDADSRAVLSSLLSASGFVTREAAGAREALRQWEEWCPHLILMDLLMPGMDGYAAIRRLRANGCGAVIIAVSASVLEDERRGVLAVGATGFLAKPVRERELLDRIGHALGLQYECCGDSTDRPQGQALRDRSFWRSALADTPDDLMRAIREAAVNARTGKLRDLVEQLHTRPPDAVSEIRQLVDRYDYDELLNLLQPCGVP